LESWQDSWRDYSGSDRAWSTLDAVRAIAKERGAPPTAVALAWLLAKPEVSSVIVGARSVAQLQENLKVTSLSLSPGEIRRLDEVSQPPWGYPYDFIGRREPW